MLKHLVSVVLIVALLILPEVSYASVRSDFSIFSLPAPRIQLEVFTCDNPDNALTLYWMVVEDGWDIAMRNFISQFVFGQCRKRVVLFLQDEYMSCRISGKDWCGMFVVVFPNGKQEFGIVFPEQQ